MTWQAITHDPVLNARQRWEKQEHDRRVRLLGEQLAEEWAQVVSELALDDGHLSQDRVLQLMEDAYKQDRVLQLMEDAYKMGAEVKPAAEERSPHEVMYRMGDDLVPASGLKKWHNDRGLPWGETFDGPEPVTMGRMARSVLGNPSLHYYNEHGGPDVPFEQVAIAHLTSHLYGRFRKGQAHYHEAPPE